MSNSCSNHHHDTADMSERALWIAIIINAILTIAELIGGIYADSLALLAEALHNSGDVATLVMALFARRISKRPADNRKNFGYHRAETVAALINLTILGITGIYLLGEAIHRFFSPPSVSGEIVIYTALFAFIINSATMLILYKSSKENLNLRAAFIHNLTDALGSVAVIIAGILILIFNWHIVDLICTILIAGYILYTCYQLTPKTIHILMEGAPEHINQNELNDAMNNIKGVQNIHHLHLWQPDEHKIALECHVVLDNLSDIEPTKKRLKTLLKEKFGIAHSTLEFENPDDIPED